MIQSIIGVGMLTCLQQIKVLIASCATKRQSWWWYAIDAAKTFLSSLRLSLPLGPSVTTADVTWRLPLEHSTEGSFEEMLSAAEKVLIDLSCQVQDLRSLNGHASQLLLS